MILLLGAMYFLLSNLGWILTIVLGLAAVSMCIDLKAVVIWHNNGGDRGAQPRSRRMDDEDGVG